MKIAMTPLQTVLRATYQKAYKARNSAASDVNDCLLRLQQLRDERDARQRWLESVGAELKASGYELADDYLNRVWPVAGYPERASNPYAAVLESV